MDEHDGGGPAPAPLSIVNRRWPSRVSIVPEAARANDGSSAGTAAAARNVRRCMSMKASFDGAPEMRSTSSGVEYRRGNEA